MFHFSGVTQETRGTAYVVYEDIFDAKNACDHLSGFNVCNRYLIVLYYQANKVNQYCLYLYLVFNNEKSFLLLLLFFDIILTDKECLIIFISFLDVPKNG